MSHILSAVELVLSIAAMFVFMKAALYFLVYASEWAVEFQRKDKQ